MGEADFLSLLKQFGPLVVFLGYFILRDKVREDRLAARLDTMQDRYAQTMETIVKENTKAANESVAATNRLCEALEDVVQKQEHRR